MRPLRRDLQRSTRVGICVCVAILMLSVGGLLSGRATASRAGAGVDAVPAAQAFTRWLREAFGGSDE